MNHEKIESTLVAILGKYGVRKIGLFGSYAHGEEEADSDLDVLVEFAETKSLLALVRIERELSEHLGIKVDLLTEQAISPYLVEKIKADLRVIFLSEG
jgi:predicted nucleotidyltransferase